MKTYSHPVQLDGLDMIRTVLMDDYDEIVAVTFVNLPDINLDLPNVSSASVVSATAINIGPEKSSDGSAEHTY